jgi:hypothetical protein
MFGWVGVLITSTGKTWEDMKSSQVFPVDVDFSPKWNVFYSFAIFCVLEWAFIRLGVHLFLLPPEVHQSLNEGPIIVDLVYSSWIPVHWLVGLGWQWIQMHA